MLASLKAIALAAITCGKGPPSTKGQPLFTVFKKPYFFAYVKAESDVKEAQKNLKNCFSGKSFYFGCRLPVQTNYYFTDKPTTLKDVLLSKKDSNKIFLNPYMEIPFARKYYRDLFKINCNDKMPDNARQTYLKIKGIKNKLFVPYFISGTCIRMTFDTSDTTTYKFFRTDLWLENTERNTMYELFVPITIKKYEHYIGYQMEDKQVVITSYWY